MSDPILKACQCSHPKCNYHGISDGSFDQGNGWDKATAERYLYARLYADYVGISTEELKQYIANMKEAGVERREL